MHIQRIRGRRVINQTLVGRSLQQVARKLGGDFAKAAGYGFQDGGCLIFASALCNWSRGTLELAAIHRVGHSGQAQHVVARFGTALFLDSDGVATEEDILRKMREVEHLRDPVAGDYDEGSRGEIPINTALISVLERELLNRLGTFERSMLDQALQAASIPAVSEARHDGCLPCAVMRR